MGACVWSTAYAKGRLCTCADQIPDQQLEKRAVKGDTAVRNYLLTQDNTIMCAARRRELLRKLGKDKSVKNNHLSYQHMEAPLSLELVSATCSRLIFRRRFSAYSGNAPKYLKTRVAHSSQLHILRQYFSGFTFYLEEISHYVKRELTIKIMIPTPCIIFIYAIQDDLSFSVPEPPQSFIIPQGYFFAHAMPAGEFLWPVNPGKKKFFYFILKASWMIRMFDVYPELTNVVQKMQDGENVNNKKRFVIFQFKIIGGKPFPKSSGIA